MIVLRVANPSQVMRGKLQLFKRCCQAGPDSPAEQKSRGLGSANASASPNTRSGWPLSKFELPSLPASWERHERRGKSNAGPDSLSRLPIQCLVRSLCCRSRINAEIERRQLRTNPGKQQRQEATGNSRCPPRFGESSSPLIKIFSRGNFVRSSRLFFRPPCRSS